MTRKRARAGSTATYEGRGEASRLQGQLLKLYGTDPEFMSELTSLASQPLYHPSALWRLACRFGLDRFGPDPLGDLGDDPDDKRIRLALQGSANLAYNALITWVDATRYGRQVPFPCLTSSAIGIEPDVAPRTIAVTWDVANETYGDARARAREAVDSALDAMAVAATEAGYVFTDTHQAEARHLVWLYRAIRHGGTWASLADAASEDSPDAVGDDAVRTAVRDVGRRAGVDVSRRRKRGVNDAD